MLVSHLANMPEMFLNPESVKCVVEEFFMVSFIAKTSDINKISVCERILETSASLTQRRQKYHYIEFVDAGHQTFTKMHLIV